MNVRAKRAFVARLNGRIHRYSDGDEFSLPAGVDWLKCDLVEPVGEPPAAKRKKATGRQAQKREKR